VPVVCGIMISRNETIALHAYVDVPATCMSVGFPSHDTENDLEGVWAFLALSAHDLRCNSKERQRSI